MGVNSLPKTVTRQRRCCDLNPGPSAPESSTVTTRLPSHVGVCLLDILLLEMLLALNLGFLKKYCKVNTCPGLRADTRWHLRSANRHLLAVYRVSGSTLTAVARSQLLARWPGTHSRILSGIQRAAQTVLDV